GFLCVFGGWLGGSAEVAGVHLGERLFDCLAQARRLVVVAVWNEAKEELEHDPHHAPPEGAIGHPLVEVPECIAPGTAHHRADGSAPACDPLRNRVRLHRGQLPGRMLGSRQRRAGLGARRCDCVGRGDRSDSAAFLGDGLLHARALRRLARAALGLPHRQALLRGLRSELEGAHQEQRKLDLFAALEFSRLQAAMSNKKTAKQKQENRERDEPSTDAEEKPSDDDHGESSTLEGKESAADRATRKAIERALTEGWGYREVKRYVDKAIAALNGPSPRKVGRRRAAFRWQEQRPQVDVARPDALEPSQKAE